MPSWSGKSARDGTWSETRAAELFFTAGVDLEPVRSTIQQQVETMCPAAIAMPVVVETPSTGELIAPAAKNPPAKTGAELRKE
jgi:hypothetical protein